MRQVSKRHRLKLDLHTHCDEAFAFNEPGLDVVSKIIDIVKSRGLDGIGIISHADKSFGYKVKRIVDEHFDSQILVIPGQEIHEGAADVVELYLPEDRVFRFLAHPGWPADFGKLQQNTYGVHGIEIENSGHNWHMDKQKILAYAERHRLMLLSNSDAHYAEDIGKFYNVVSLEELHSHIARVEGKEGVIP